MVIKKTENLEIGDTLSTPIVSPKSATLYPKNTVVTNDVKSILYLNDISYVTVNDTNNNSDTDEFINTIKKEFDILNKRLITGNSRKIEQQIETIYDVSSYLLDSILDNKHLTENYFHFKISDTYTYVHSLNVALTAMKTQIQLNSNRDMVLKVGLGALLHDIGKFNINPSIVNKRAKLTKEEMDYMKTHVNRGHSIVSRLDIPFEAKEIILNHHEKLDGSGYPSRLNYKQIPKYVRLVTIADIYDALISERSYKVGWDKIKAVETMEYDIPSKIDEELFYKFLEYNNFLEVDERIILSDDVEGKILKYNNKNPLKPIVMTEKGTLIDLSRNTNIKLKQQKYEIPQIINFNKTEVI